MAFNHTDYIRSFLMIPGQNGATKYGVMIQAASVPLGQPYWRCIGIHHLTGPENHGQHNVFCDVLDEQGNRLYGTKLVVVNINHDINHIIIDKGKNEPGTNAPMHWDDELEFYVATGGLASDKAAGFHTRHEDEPDGNTRGHHSFYVVWQRTKPGATPPPIVTPPIDPVEAPADDPQAPPVEEPAPGHTYSITGPSFYIVSAGGRPIAQVTTLDWARRIVAGLTLLDASDADHPINRYREELEKWNRGEALE